MAMVASLNSTLQSKGDTRSQGTQSGQLSRGVAAVCGTNAPPGGHARLWQCVGTRREPAGGRTNRREGLAGLGAEATLLQCHLVCTEASVHKGGTSTKCQQIQPIWSAFHGFLH